MMDSEEAAPAVFAALPRKSLPVLFHSKAAGRCHLELRTRVRPGRNVAKTYSDKVIASKQADNTDEQRN